MVDDPDAAGVDRAHRGGCLGRCQVGSPVGRDRPGRRYCDRPADPGPQVRRRRNRRCHLCPDARPDVRYRNGSVVTWTRRHWAPLAVLVVAVAGLATLTLVASRDGRHRPTAMMGAVEPGRAPVRSLTQARAAADAFGAGWGLHAGEVLQFDNGFYAELLDSTGAGATEVLIDAATGTVAIEYGPAMMWNTAYGMTGNGGYGMHRYRAATVIGAEQA